MSIKDVAADLVRMWNSSQWQESGEKYWAQDAVSCEPMEGPMARIQGIEALRGKAKWWADNHETHSMNAEGPYINGDQFLVRFSMDVTSKQDGKRMQLKEFGLYTIKDGKIAEERFFMEG
jgi:ketosteroid isomerase-like protein